MLLLDTDTCIYLLNGRLPAARVEQLRGMPADEVGVAAVTVAELRFGALNSARPRANIERVDIFVGPLVRVPFEDRAAANFGRIKHHLTRRGRMIGVMDLLIAATALAVGATVVTRNVAEFTRVPALSVENWME